MNKLNIMKKILFILPFIFLFSCEKEEADNSYSLDGVWQYDSWLYNGDQILSDVSAYLFICENENTWATEIYDLQGDPITSLCNAGTFNINADQTGTFTQSYSLSSSMTWTPLALPQTLSVTITKLDNDELDFVMIYDGNTETISSVKSPTLNTLCQ